MPATPDLSKPSLIHKCFKAQVPQAKRLASWAINHNIASSWSQRGDPDDWRMPACALFAYARVFGLELPWAWILIFCLLGVAFRIGIANAGVTARHLWLDRPPEPPTDRLTGADRAGHAGRHAA